MTRLADLPQGSVAVIADVAGASVRRDRLATFGLVPGTVVILLQRRPALVLAVDGSEIALDRRIAAGILVR